MYVSNQNDVVIIEKVLAGDCNAYASIVNEYKDMAVTLAYNILLNKEDAEEAAQDAFVKSYSALRSFNGASKFSTWLYRIVVNTALNKRKLKKLKPVELTAYHDESLNDAYYHAATINNEQRKFIQRSLRSLNDKERICITLYYLNELSVEEIKKVTGISISNIKVLLFRGRKSLYTALHSSLKDEITTLI